MAINRALYSSENMDWETPPALFEKLDREFHFTLDVCALPHNAKCRRFFSPKKNGLAQRWSGVCWMNPPYGDQLPRWMMKAYGSSLKGVTVVCLVPARTDTRWWHWWVEGKADVRFIEGRIKFVGAKNSAPFPSAIVIYRPRPK